MLEKDLELIGSCDEEVAREAYERALDACDSYLRCALRKWEVKEDDLQDVIAETKLRLWNYRCRYRALGASQWRRLLVLTATRCLINLAAQRGHIDPGIEAEDIPDSEVHLVAAVAQANITLAEINAKADEFWLGLDKDLHPNERNRQLMAAQLFYLDDLPWNTVALMLSRSRPGTHYSRQQLDDILEQPGVILHLVYSQLYMPSEKLAHYLLGREEIVQGKLDLKLPAVTDPIEEDICLWRFRNLMTMEQILRRAAGARTFEQITALIDRFTQSFPFNEIMLALLKGLENAPKSAKLLGHAGLWKRLAFQYWGYDQLPHKDLRARVQPAADPVGYDLTLDRLQLWFSNGRLPKSLGRYIKQRHHV